MNWSRFKQYYLNIESLGFALDISRMHFKDEYLAEMKPKMTQAFRAMEDLEAGAIANPDENRMVGHYWLRDPKLAPTKEIKNAIHSSLEHILDFAQKVHSGEIRGPLGPFKNVLLIGIGEGQETSVAGSHFPELLNPLIEDTES